MVVILGILVYVIVVCLNIILGRHVPGLVEKDDTSNVISFVILSIIPVINAVILVGCLIFALIQYFKDYIRR